MNVRRATPDDFEAVAELWKEFDHEIPPPTHEGPSDHEKELAEVREILESEIAFVALDDDETPVGFALARERAPGFGTLTDLYVRELDRRSGVGTDLMRSVLEAFESFAVRRVKIGVGRPAQQDAVARHVLDAFDPGELAAIDQACTEAAGRALEVAAPLPRRNRTPGQRSGSSASLRAPGRLGGPFGAPI